MVGKLTTPAKDVHGCRCMAAHLRLTLDGPAEVHRLRSQKW